MMKCLNCNTEIENDDNFCPNCGHWTTKGYKYFNDDNNVSEFMTGREIVKNNRLSALFSILFTAVILFALMVLFRGNSLFKPLIYLKKQFTSYQYGYNISIIKTDNIYHKLDIPDYEASTNIIRKDFDEQRWKCLQDVDSYKLEEAIEESYAIISVNFCDIDYAEAEKIKGVIDKMYNLFPSIKGGLTNITISNASTKSEYIAYFQPMNQFVNPNDNINSYNKVNKTQILLNSYYFLNKNMLGKNINEVVGNGWYVEDASWESTIAHELGHYIVFKLYLKDKGINNIIFVNKENEAMINNMMTEYDSGIYADNILNEALANYNKKYNLGLDTLTFAEKISRYAANKDGNGELISDETLAEAIHDYYLHGDNCKKESKEIMEIIKSKI